MAYPALADKKPFVRDVFTSVAQRYDIMNDAMSFGLHRLWKRTFISQLALQPDEALLDMAGGTGDIAFGVVQRMPAKGIPITLADINPAMLAEGQRRAQDKGLYQQLQWLCADAEHLPIPDQAYHAYTIAFGLRNVTDTQQALCEATRVLRYGGRFLCLEFSAVALPWLDAIYQRYSQQIIPKLGQLLAKDSASYEYLVDSIRAFPTAERLQGMMMQAGLRQCRYRLLSGGIVAIHQGYRL